VLIALRRRPAPHALADYVFWNDLEKASGPFLPLFLANAVLGGLLAAGARQMGRLEAYALSVLTGLSVLLPVPAAAWPVGLAAGVWALWALRRPEVKAAFAEELRRRTRAPEPAPASRTPRPSALPAGLERGGPQAGEARNPSECAGSPSAEGAIDSRRLVNGLAAALLVGGTVLLRNASSGVGNGPHTGGYAALGLGGVAAVVRLAMRPPPGKGATHPTGASRTGPNRSLRAPPRPYAPADPGRPSRRGVAAARHPLDRPDPETPA
jgi:hypothetical protein